MVIDRYRMLINFVFQKQIRENKLYIPKKIQSPIIISSPVIHYPFLLKHYYNFYIDEKAKKALKKHKVFISKNKLKTIVE
jgi:phage terminase large subunit